MFFKLFAKECGQMLKSLIYYLFSGCAYFLLCKPGGKLYPIFGAFKGAGTELWAESQL